MAKKRTSPLTAHAQKHVSNLFSTIGVAALSIAIVSVFALAFIFALPALQGGQMAAVISSVLVDLTNKERTTEDLGTLTVNPVLAEAAQAKANDMAAKGYFAHTSPEGLTSWSWFKQVGYSFSYAGENLAVDFSDSKDVEKAWMNSPTHRANIMNGHFTEIGIATAEGEYKGKKAIFVVQMFGTPARSQSAAPIKTASATVPAEEIATAERREEVLGSSAESEKIVAGAPKKLAIQTAPKEEPVAPAQVAPTVQPEASPIAHAAASPKNTLRTVYQIVAGFLLLAFLIMIGREFRTHHTRRVFALSFLVLLMSGLYVVFDRVFAPAPIIETAQAAEVTN
ncbi:MAG: hypothetical protein JWN64_364 [Parcubacteria group bacterium]|nr:hypothetical protein [Parcubacteria group bacterium]